MWKNAKDDGKNREIYVYFLDSMHDCLQLTITGYFIK